LLRAGSKEETREAFQETKLQVLLVRLRGARPSLPSVNSRNKLARAAKAASVKLGSVIEGTDPFPSKPSVLSEFAERFDTWVEDGRLERKPRSSIAMAGAYSKRLPLRVCESTKSREISLSN
jgi:hypothetical protein